MPRTRLTASMRAVDAGELCTGRGSGRPHQCAQGDGAGELITEGIYRGPCSLSGVHDFPGVLKKDFAGRRERDLALGPVEQFDAKFLFQPADRRREGRLHNVYPLGGPGEVQLAILSRFAIVGFVLFSLDAITGSGVGWTVSGR